MHKRALGTVAIIGSAALLATACGGDSKTTGSTTTPAAGTSTAAPSDTGTAAATSGTPATLSTKDPARDANADLVIWTDADRAPTVQKVADGFAAEQGGLKVAVQIAPDTRQQFKDATKVGKGPDIVVGAHDWMGELVQTAVVAPISLDPATAGKLAPNAMAAARFNGQTYGVPYATENLALMRNTAMVPNAPKTMDELLKMAGEAKAKDAKITNLLIQPVGKTGNAYYTYPYLAAFGGGIFGQKANGDYDAAKLIVSSPESIKGAQVLAQLGKQKVLSTNVGDDNAEGLFDAGKAPFMITGPWGVTNAKKANIKYAISPLPSLTGGGAMQPLLGVQLFYVSSKAKNASIAQEFVTNWITKKDVQLELFQALNRPPALTEALTEVAANDADIKAFTEAGKDAKPMPNIPAMNSVWGPLGQAAADVISGQDPTTRFAAAAKEIAANIAKG